MNISNAVVLVTGANRGIGAAFVEAALARGAKKVYAGARDPASITQPGAHPLQLDVTSDDDVVAAARQCQDATLIINNAGIGRMGPLLVANAIALASEHLDTNVFGMLRMMQAFAPILGGHGGGAFINVLSVASWINSGAMTAYGVSKSAAWSLTNGLRSELRSQHTQVLALHMGFVDTDMTKGLDVVKVSPAEIVKETFDALEAGASEVLADERSRMIKRGLTGDPLVYL